jgi:hypothetical protein
MAAYLATALMESEFINSLASPQQLFHLSNNGFLTPEQLARLEALHQAYASDPLKLATLRYPQALEHLRLLYSSARFREQLKNPGFIDFLAKQSAAAAEAAAPGRATAGPVPGPAAGPAPGAKQ